MDRLEQALFLMLVSILYIILQPKRGGRASVGWWLNFFFLVWACGGTLQCLGQLECCVMCSDSSLCTCMLECSQAVHKCICKML